MIFEHKLITLYENNFLRGLDHIENHAKAFDEFWKEYYQTYSGLRPSQESTEHQAAHFLKFIIDTDLEHSSATLRQIEEYAKKFKIPSVDLVAYIEMRIGLILMKESTSDNFLKGLGDFDTYKKAFNAFWIEHKVLQNKRQPIKDDALKLVIKIYLESPPAYINTTTDNCIKRVAQKFNIPIPEFLDYIQTHLDKIKL